MASSSVNLSAPDVSGEVVVPEAKPSASWGRNRTLFRCGDFAVPLELAPVVRAWVLGLTSGVLLLALFGLTRPLEPSQNQDATPLMSLDLSSGAMVELTAPTERVTSAPSVQPTPTEVIEQDPTVEPMVDPVMEMQEAIEMVEVLTEEDLFAVPAAPAIDEARTPNEPKPAPAPPPPAAPPPSMASSSPTASPTASSSSGGAGAGSTAASGTLAKGTFPAPPYPGFARSRGMQGTVYLSISVDGNGAPASITVSRSSGFQELDRYAADFVRRNWKWTDGRGNTYRLPLVFKLR